MRFFKSVFFSALYTLFLGLLLSATFVLSPIILIGFFFILLLDELTEESKPLEKKETDKDFLNRIYTNSEKRQ